MCVVYYSPSQDYVEPYMLYMCKCNLCDILLFHLTCVQYSGQNIGKFHYMMFAMHYLEQKLYMALTHLCAGYFTVLYTAEPLYRGHH